MPTISSHRLLSLALVLFPLSAVPVAAALFRTDPPPPARPVTIRQLLSGLDDPTSVTNAGDTRLFVTEQPGRVRVVKNGALLAAPFLDIRPLVRSGGEQGLLSIAFHPRYAQNGLFFVFYTDLQGSEVIARYHAAADPDRADPASARILLTVPDPFENHNGGQLQFGPDGKLYIGLGDGGSGGDPSCFAQRDANLLGKILRIDVDANADTPPFYGIPADNPFRGASPMPDEVWAYGLRNPWRFSFDRRTGDLWIADVGQGVREEVDFEPARSPGGRNYGWKVMEGSLCFSRQECPASTPVCDSPELVKPVVEYDHGAECSVTGGYVSRSPSLPHAYGAYFFGDFCSGRLWTADRQGAGWQVRSLSADLGSLSSFGEGIDGELYLVSLQGGLYQVVPVRPVDTPGLYDPAAARFDVKNLDVAGPADRTLVYGTPGGRQLPIAGDWNGDGRTTVGVYNPATGTFRLKNVLRRVGQEIVLTVNAPAANAIPLAGDWNGDGKDTVGLFVPATATFYLKNSLTGSGFDAVFQFGVPGIAWQPLAGDWNGDGRDTIGLYDPARALFLLRNALAAGAADLRFRFGPTGSRPLAGDWDGDGRDGIGIWSPAAATFLLKNVPQRGAADITFAFGTRGSGQLPLAGEW
jgi:glucose/arabinose dehydrogenase